MHAFSFPSRLTKGCVALLCLFFMAAAFPAHSDSLPPFVMPKIASWPEPEKPLPAAIEEKDLPSVTVKAKAGDIEAQMQLVRYYSDSATSYGQPRDLDEAKAWNRKAAETGEPLALFMQAVWLIREEGHSHTTLAMLEKAASAGSGMAAYYLGNYYREEDKQPAKAIHCYRTAVKNRFQPAALELAEIYYPVTSRQIDIQPDIVTAYAWRILAEKGREERPEKNGSEKEARIEHNREQLVMLPFFMLPSERKAALKMLAPWPEQLPPAGDTRLFSEVSQLQRLTAEESRTLYEQALNGDKKSIKQFLTLYFAGQLYPDRKDTVMPVLVKGAAMGVNEAISMLGWAYIEGQHIAKDEKKGYAMLHAQAARNDPLAFYLLGALAAENASQAKTGEKTALSWFEKGAASGDTRSMLMLGQHFQEHDNIKKAAFWYEKAARAGSEQALMALLGLAESARDIPALTRWMGLIILRAADPMVVYRTRSMMGQIAYGQDWDEYQKTLLQAEKWHRANPLPAKKQNVTLLPVVR